MLRSLNQFKQIVQIEMNCVQINECRFLSVRKETVGVCMLISVQCMRFSQMNHLLYYVSKSINRRHSRPEGKSTKESTLCRIRFDTTQTQ